MEKEIIVTTNADLERLCNALELPNVFYLFPPEVVFDQSPADALFWCETHEEAQADIDSRCPPGAWIWEGPPPVATDAAAAVIAMEAVAAKISTQHAAVGWEAIMPDRFSPGYHVCITLGQREISWADAGTLPAAVFGALLQALDAGAIGAAKGDPHED